MDSKQNPNILNQIGQFLERSEYRLWVLTGMLILSAMGMIAAATPIAEYPPEGQSEVIEQLEILSETPLLLQDEIFLREERIARGDTFGTLLSRLGLEDAEARNYILFAPELQKLHRQMVPGRTVSARLTETGQLVSLFFPMNGGETLTIVERKNGKLSSIEKNIPFETRQITKTGEIHYSLFGATDNTNIPDSIATQMAEIFSGLIDFHRSLRKGDRFTLVYEMNYYQGQPMKSGRILSAEFTNGGKTFQAFYFEHGGKGGYYDATGNSLKKAFLRAPLEFSRITSGFSMRFHPIFKTWRAHTGVDYGAPTGTKVQVTGDGVVAFVGVQNGYGNIVLVSHTNGYQTAYAHLSKFPAGLRQGNRVSQGDIIGYVGSTGWATGPHLHYEFRRNGKATNPLSITIPSSPPLDKSLLTHFESEIKEPLSFFAAQRHLAIAQFE